MQIISVSKKAVREVQKRCHGGKGQILFREVFNKRDFESNLQHLHETVISPKSTIGIHLHTGNEEIYYILEGNGIYLSDTKTYHVHQGDAVVVHSGGKHALNNTTDKELKILVFQCNYSSRHDKI